MIFPLAVSTSLNIKDSKLGSPFGSWLYFGAPCLNCWGLGVLAFKDKSSHLMFLEKTKYCRVEN